MIHYNIGYKLRKMNGFTYDKQILTKGNICFADLRDPGRLARSLSIRVRDDRENAKILNNMVEEHGRYAIGAEELSFYWPGTGALNDIPWLIDGRRMINRILVGTGVINRRAPSGEWFTRVNGRRLTGNLACALIAIVRTLFEAQEVFYVMHLVKSELQQTISAEEFSKIDDVAIFTECLFRHCQGDWQVHDYNSTSIHAPINKSEDPSIIYSALSNLRTLVDYDTESPTMYEGNIRYQDYSYELARICRSVMRGGLISVDYRIPPVITHTIDSMDLEDIDEGITKDLGKEYLKELRTHA